MLILVMGVTGAGKTTVARGLAARVGLSFYDADDFHPAENRRKMAENQPLDDADRRPWLELLASLAVEWDERGGAVLACSALKRWYRELLFQRVADHRTIYLEISRNEVSARLERRRGQHAFIRDYDRVLSGQFADLEVPDDAIRIPAELDPDQAIELATRALIASGLRPQRAEPRP